MFEFWKDLVSQVCNLKASLATHINEDIHIRCAACGIIGHKPDMKEHIVRCGYSRDYKEYYHNGCYAEKFNKHLCPNKCGKWLDNKKKK